MDHMGMASETPRNTTNPRGRACHVMAWFEPQVDQEAQGLSRMVSWISCRFFWVEGKGLN